MHIWYLIVILIVFNSCSSVAQQRIYFPLTGTTKDTPKTAQSKAQPSNGDPFRPFEFSLVEAIIDRNPEMKSYVDSIFIANTSILPFKAKRSRLMENQIHGLIIDFVMKRIKDEFVSQITSIQPVVHFKFDYDSKVVMDTLQSLEVVNSCAEPEYSYLLNTVDSSSENLELVKYIRNIYDEREHADLFDGKFQSQTYGQFRSKDVRIDTSVIFGYGSYEERIVIDTTIFEWSDHKPTMISEIHFCTDALSISLEHTHIGLAREAIDPDTGEFKYYWPTLYIKNERIE